MLGQVKSS